MQAQQQPEKVSAQQNPEEAPPNQIRMFNE
jgi:hypothetical protein